MDEFVPSRGPTARRKDYFIYLTLGPCHRAGRSAKGEWIVDGSLTGHWTSFMNCSKSATTATVTMAISHGLPCFYAKRTLTPGAEYTFYYETSSGCKSPELIAAQKGACL